jgi:glycosyltransferase involved in cell wall biosynthesis
VIACTRRPLIALLSPSLEGGGAERVLLNLAGGLVAEGIGVDVVLAQPTGVFLSQLPTLARVIDLKASRIASSVLPLARYLREVRPDALLAFQDHTSVAAIAAAAISLSRTPIFPAIHSTWTKMLETGGWRQHLLASVASLAYRHAAGVITVSDGAAASLVSCLGVERSRVRVIYNPVVTGDLFSKAEAAVEHPWFKAGQPPVVLGIGRLSRAKDFATLIASFAQLRAHCPARLLILGEGEERPALETLIRKLRVSEDVALPGFVENPYPYLRQSAVFVLSSAWEGLPTVLIEALALGVPIVSTDCPSGPAEILSNGRHGDLVPVGNIEAMADAMYKSITTKHLPPDAASWEKFTVPSATAAYIDALLPSPVFGRLTKIGKCGIATR